MNKVYSIIILLVFFGCKNTQEQVPEAQRTVKGMSITLTSAQKEKAGIVIGTLLDTSLSSTIHVHGKIDVPPQNLASISVPMGGFLRSTRLLPGMKVHKGETIAMLEDQQYIQLQEDYLTIKAQLMQAEADYNRQRALSEVKAGSDKVFEKARAEYQTLIVKKSSLAQKLRMIYINPQTLTEQTITRSIAIPSPFDGFVTKVFVNIGKYVLPSDILFELVNPDDIHLNLKVFEKDLIQLSIGQKLQAYINSKPEKRYECDILLISNSIVEDGTAEVHCHFKDYDDSLVPGMFMNADIALSNHKTKALPESAILEFEDGYYVFIHTGKDSYTMHKVSIGARENGFVEILDTNYVQGKNIVVQGAYTLLMALKNVE